MSEGSEGSRDARIVGLALQRGLLDLDDVSRVSRRSSSGGTTPGERVAVLRELLRLGRIDEKTVDELSREVESAGSAGGEGPAKTGVPERGPVSRWGRYELGPALGAGGMGEVWKAFDPTLNRTVALKLLQSVRPASLDRFRDEARAQARVEHPNICRIYEVGEVKGKPYLALQYIDGKTLLDLAPELSTEQKVSLLAQIAEAVHAAHKTGLIHRDLKPTNMMVERREDGELVPYVMDFGLAREMEAPGLTRSGLAAGTPNYMAPEQIQGDAALDRRTDVYALGATLYELLSGRPPFEGKTDVEVMMRLVREEPRPLRAVTPSLPADLETVVMKCLEKEPGRRYDSAKALAEDLRRFLAGDAIAARHVSLGERLVRKARKNRLATALLLAATVLILGLLGVAVRTRLKAAETARLAGRLGAEVARLEEIARLSRMLPLHDTRKEKAVLRQRIARLEGGREGPALYARGRAHLVLNELPSARDLLEKAWKSGFREPEAAYALGVCLGRVYQGELDALRGISSKDLREARRKAIEKELRDPAVSYLRQGRDLVVEAPEYAEGLLALYEKRYDVATAKAGEALAKSPWLFEAHRLLGDVHTALANARRDAGDETGALAEYLKADAAYRDGVRIAPSDADLYEGLAGLWTLVLHMQASGKEGDLPAAYARVVEAAGNASAADPERAAGEEKLAWASWIHGEALKRRGGDPGEAYATAVRAARKAIDLEPGNAAAYRHLGTALQLLGDVEYGAGRDPRERLTEAVAAYRKALERRPGDVFTLNSLGNTQAILGDYENANGLSPRASIGASIETFRKVIEIDPTFTFAYNNLAISQKDLGRWEHAHGLYEDARKSLDAGVATAKKAVEINPTYLFALNTIANTLTWRARLEVDLGRDPEPFLAEGASACEKAIAINPKYPSARGNLGAIHQARGLAALRRGEDPEPHFLAAEEAYRKKLELTNGKDTEAYQETSVIERVRARRALDTAATRPGGDPGKHLAEARRLLGEALALNPTAAGLHQRAAEIELVAADAEIARGRSPEPALARAREAVARALAKDDGRARTYEVAAEIERAAVAWLRKSGRTADRELVEGRRLAQEALRRNPASAEARRLLAALDAPAETKP